MQQYRRKKYAQSAIKAVINILFAGAGVLICIPVALIVTGSVMGEMDLMECLAPVFEQGRGFVTWKLIPGYPTVEPYSRLLLYSPDFFVLFWNSVKLTGLILAGQMLAGTPAAWAFAVYRTKGRDILFTLYIVLMLLPFQATMLSSYLTLNRLALLNTHLAVILPAIFHTFPVFIMYSGFRSIPRDLIDAARIDGAGEFTIFMKIGLLLGRDGVLSALVLGFLEYWNMIEQPYAFLEDKFLWPISLYLPEITWKQAGFAFSASVLMLVPSVFVFIMGQDYLEQGIVYSGLKY